MGLKRWLVASVLGVLAPIVAGCGGDDDGGQLTGEEFFQALAVLDDEYEAAGDELEASFEPAMERAASDEERIAVFVSFTEDGAVVLEDFVDGIASLNAPDELIDFQDGAVSAGQAVIDSLEQVLSALGDVSTEEELVAVLAGAGTQEPFGRFNAICLEAENLAEDAGVDVDYDCEQE